MDYSAGLHSKKIVMICGLNNHAQALHEFGFNIWR